MGFLDSVKNFFNDVGSTIKSGAESAFQWVSNNAPAVVDTAKDGVKWIASKGESAVSTVYGDVKDYIGKSQDTVKDVIGLGGKVIETTGNTISNVGNALSMPLVIGVALLGGFLLINRK